jgi:hypothetical protein
MLGSNSYFNRVPSPGSFASLYKYILNALPLLYQPPVSRPSFIDDEEDIQFDPPRPTYKRVRELRLSASGRARQAWTKKRTKAWFSVVAGAIAGGVAITFEKRSRRVAIGQQMFVRSVGSAKISAICHSLSDAQRASRIVQCIGRQVWTHSPARGSLALLHRLCPDYVQLLVATGHASKGLYLLD